MSYVVLARQYRPRCFSEMVGQDHVVQALSNALKVKRLHHAYLFTGTRGVGKTTISRILAKSLNCIGPDGQGDITAEPCGVCQVCRDIDEGRFVDYIELDAASNRGVEEISQLLEQAVYKPVVGRFKVFMIDEVHMLSNTAFNAMLKTLEEPPEYLKFVLATTDPQKVPVTVLSRCLQFNLRPMAPQTIAEYLVQVLQKEQVTYDEGSLQLLSREAKGSMRDALSLVDQAIAFGSGQLEEAAVRQMLGSVDQTSIYELMKSIAAGDGQAIVARAQQFRQEGYAAKAVLEELSGILQKLEILRVAPEALQQNQTEVQQIGELLPLLAADESQLIYSVVLNGQDELGLASDEYAALTMVLLRVLAFRPFGNHEPTAIQASPTSTVTKLENQEGTKTTSALAEKKTAVTTDEVARPTIITSPVASTENPQQDNRTGALAVEKSTHHAAPQIEQTDGDDDLPPWLTEGNDLPQEFTPAIHNLQGIQNSQSSAPVSLPITPTTPVAETIPFEHSETREVQQNRLTPKFNTEVVTKSYSADSVNQQTEGELTAESHSPAPHVDTNSSKAVPLNSSPASERWFGLATQLIEEERVVALVRELVLQVEAVHIDKDEKKWQFNCEREILITAENNQNKFALALGDLLGHPVEVVVESGKAEDTLAFRIKQKEQLRQEEAEQAVAEDPDVQKWLRQFPGAKIVPGSLKAV